MKYQEMKDHAVKDGTMKKLNPTFIQFEKKNQEIIGEFVSRNEVVSSRGQGSYNQYLFQTDKGLVKFALGSATDKEVGNNFKEGHVYLIVFLEKSSIGAGRAMNKYLISEIETELSGALDDEEVPF